MRACVRACAGERVSCVHACDCCFSPLSCQRPSSQETHTLPSLRTIGDCFDKQEATYGDRLALVVIPQVCPPAPASLKDTTLKQTSILSFLSSVFFLLFSVFFFSFQYSF